MREGHTRFDESLPVEAALRVDEVCERFEAPAVPEPSSLALLAIGGLALAGWRRWRKRATALPYSAICERFRCSAPRGKMPSRGCYVS
jgi:hypothetical protein